MSCPICGRKTDAKSKPFCSRRCADIDLARWFDGTYARPLDEEEESEQKAAPDLRH